MFGLNVFLENCIGMSEDENNEKILKDLSYKASILDAEDLFLQYKKDLFHMKCRHTKELYDLKKHHDSLMKDILNKDRERLVVLKIQIEKLEKDIEEEENKIETVIS